jgi:[ribosomal protein S5]-alanine N-acetyltransferase
MQMSLVEIEYRPPRVETEHLVLRGYEPNDAKAIFEYASDPETTRYMAWNRSRTLEDVHHFLDVIVAHNYEHSELDYAITLREDEQCCIGGIGLYWRPREHQVMELGYILRRDHWGKGIIPEAGRALLQFVVANSDVERIYAPIFACNAKSRRAAEKLGMQLDGVLRSALSLHGQRWDEAIYSILRSDVIGVRADEARAGAVR